MQSRLDKIKAQIDAGQVPVALAMVDEALARPGADRAALFYLKGRAYMKTASWGQAMNAFMAAERLSPGSPAAEARQMLADILGFYHKDLYNP